MLIEVDAKVFCHDGPDPDVKLSTIEEEWVFNVFLNDPRLCLRVLVEDKLVYISQIPEQLDTSTLVQRSRLDQPHVLSTVLDWDPFLVGAAPRNLFVPCHQLVYFIFVRDS